MHPRDVLRPDKRRLQPIPIGVTNALTPMYPGTYLVFAPMRSRAASTGAEEEIVLQQVRVAGPARLRRGPPLLVHNVLLFLPPEDPAEDLHAEDSRGGPYLNAGETTVTIEEYYPRVLK